MERWERELEHLKDVDAPPSTRARMDAGPTGEGMPPSSNRGQRIAAGVVACLVFMLGAGLVMAAFRSDADAPPLAPAEPGSVVVTLAGEGDDAVATMSFGESTTGPVVGSTCWSEENGAQRCADASLEEPFDPADFLVVPEGTSFTLAQPTGADPVTFEITPGNDPTSGTASISMKELAGLPADVYVLSVIASWEGRGEAVTFRFPLRVSSLATPPSQLDPATEAADRELEATLTGSSWALAQLDGVTLDIGYPPTVIISTRLGGYTGCNSYGTDDWWVSDGRLVTGGLVQTLIGCGGSLEARFTEILHGEPVIATDGVTLELTSDDGSMVFDRIDRDQDDVVGSFLDCWTDGRVEVRPSLDAPTAEEAPAYLRVNLPWIDAGDDFTRIGETDRWAVVRDLRVIAEIWAEDLSGIACPDVRS